MSNYLSMSLEEINLLLRNKTIKPIDLVNEAYEKIEQNDLNAFITLCKEDAINKAIELEGKEVDSIYFGIPITIKDNFLTKGVKTTCASRTLDNFIPIVDAEVVSLINESNMIIIGKTNMDEFAMGSTGETSYYGPVKNPLNNSLVTGGSSSGSAASVAASFANVSIGSDTGGSVRQPACFCGCVGLKPTYGRISRFGLVAFAQCLDTVGIFTNNITDSAHMMNLLSKKDDKDLTSIETNENFLDLINKDIKGIKICVFNYTLSEEIDSNIVKNTKAVLKYLEENGASITYMDSKYMSYSTVLYQIIALSLASSSLARFDGINYGYKASNYDCLDDFYKKTRTESFGNEVKRRIMVGTALLSSENVSQYYEKALKLRGALTREVEEIFSEYDFIISPTTASMPSEINDNREKIVTKFNDDMFTVFGNMTGVPSLSMPIYKIGNLYSGLLINSKKNNEKEIFRLAKFIENKMKEDNYELN